MFPMTEEATLEEVSHFLINRKLLLTALELDFELIERGQENKVLRSFFTNPMNFECVSVHSELSNTRLKSSPSISTIDSIDFAKYSDDGMQQSDERIKVLEFELRKKSEEVRKLREELTEMSVSAVHTSFVLDWLPSSLETGQTGLLLAHENRTLNFLINEYLLQHRFKLTAVSFSEEVSGQDLDSWDDVGLNIPKLPSLEYLLKTKLSTLEECSHKFVEQVEETRSDHEVQTDPMDNGLLEHYIILTDQLKDTLKSLEEDIAAMTQSHNQVLIEKKSQTQLMNQLKRELNESKSKLICAQRDLVQESLKKKVSTQAPNSSGGETDIKSETISEISAAMDDGGNVERVKYQGHVDDQGDDFEDHKCDQQESGFSEVLPQRAVTKEFLKLLRLIQVEGDVSCSSIPLVSSLDEFVNLTTVMLPHLFKVISSKDDPDLMMLLIQSTCLHPETKQREKLLKFLINLYSEPSSSERNLVMRQIETLAGYLGAFRVEAELITQIWEMLYEKPKLNSCKRILLANICGVVCPLAPTNLRSSLILSIHQQMLEEESDPKVVPYILGSIASTIPYLEDVDKISTLIQLTFKYLFRSNQLNDVSKHDPMSPNNEPSAEEVVMDRLLPAVAQWCLDAGVIHSALLKDIMTSLDSCHINNSEYQLINRHLTIIHMLLPFLEIWIKSSVPNISSDSDKEPLKESAPPSYSCDRPSIYKCEIIVGLYKYQEMQARFIRYTSTNIPQYFLDSSNHNDLDTVVPIPCWSPWPHFRWIQSELVSRMVLLLRSITPKVQNIDLSDQKVISDLAKSQFTNTSPKSKDTCIRTSGIIFELCCRLSYPVVHDVIVPFITNHLYESSDKGADCDLKTTEVITGLVAGHSAVLASLYLLDPSTLSADNLRRFLTNLYFLISAEKLSFEGVKQSMSVLCTYLSCSDVIELVLPAMQPCVDCPDCSVQMLMCITLLELVSDISAKCPLDNVLHEIITILQRLIVSVHESVRLLTIGPLVSILQIPSLSPALRLQVFNSLTDLMKESVNFSLELTDSVNSSSNQPCSEIMITALIQMINIVGASSPDSFRDEAILPWLLGITEINNSTSDLASRSAIAMILYSTFSTLSYYVESSNALETCLLPSLDRLKLDMLEIYPENVKEVESMSQEIRKRLEVRQRVSSNEGLSAAVKNKISHLNFMNRSSGMTTATSSLFGKIKELKDGNNGVKSDDQLSTSSSSSTTTKSNISNFFSKRK